MSEKTEKATPYKLQKAREKGQVSKSNDVTSSVYLLVLLGLITALWPKIFIELQNLMRHLLNNVAKTQISADKAQHIQYFILEKILSMWLPFAIAGVLAISLTTLAQTGLVWSATPLIPDMKRLSFVTGFKKLYSLKTCFETLKSMLKLSTAILLVAAAIHHNLDTILQLPLSQPSLAPELMMRVLLKILFQLVLLLSALALLDKLYTRWTFAKDNRMSKQEIKEEYKQRDGDPKIKAKIKQLQFQLRLKTASLKQVRTADLIITNPTHLAIALKYDKQIMPAPKVVCKAQGEAVELIKKIARKHRIPIIENKPFARALYHSIALNQWISSDLYPIAAELFREIYAQKESA